MKSLPVIVQNNEVPLKKGELIVTTCHACRCLDSNLETDFLFFLGGVCGNGREPYFVS
jgi:hypothetical protein